MCMGGGSKPTPPPLPPEPPPPPSRVDPEVVRARSSNKRAAALATGRDKTILTTAQGLTTPANTTGPKTLLGA